LPTSGQADSFPKEAGKRHWADFGECLLLEVEPSFLPAACPSLERALRFSMSTFLLSCLGQKPKWRFGRLERSKSERAITLLAEFVKAREMTQLHLQ